MSIKNKKCLVIGGAGFIGSHITDILVDAGAQVSILTRKEVRHPENINKTVSVCIGDVTKIETIEVYFKNIDYVFYCVAIANIGACIDDPITCYNTHVMGTINVLECSRKNLINKIIFSSSNIVYTENNPYSSSMIAAEGIVNLYRNLYKQDSVILRYSNVYGPRQSNKWKTPTVFAAFKKQKEENGKIRIMGDGLQTRDYTHVYDIARANLYAVNSPYCGTIDICTGINTPLIDVAIKYNCEIEHIEGRKGDSREIIQKPDAAMDSIGWKYAIKLEDGIKDVL